VGRIVYLSASQTAYNFLTVIIKTAIDTPLTSAILRKLVSSVDPTLPLHHIRTLDALLATSVAQQRFQMVLVAAFSLLIFVVAIIGTYGVTSYSVTERTRELALRVALGASRQDIRGLVLRQGSRMALVGIAIGGVLAATLSRVLTRFVFHVSTLDLAAFVVAPLLLASSVLLATYTFRRGARHGLIRCTCCVRISGRTEDQQVKRLGLCEYRTVSNTIDISCRHSRCSRRFLKGSSWPPCLSRAISPQ
jgi:predicted lysophospholipase L1 biosynthesis ABC-type transport system permease subunit